MKAKYFLMMLVVLGICSFTAAKKFTADGIAGLWNYRISDVPPEYETGFFTFEEKDSKTVGYMGAEKREMKDLVVAQGKVTFAMDFDGGVIKYNLTQTGDTLAGIVATQYGDFPIKAIRDTKK
ncbi:hypothetical protein HWI92_06910 [Dyadobacter sandarakinus]|uniref:Uncharacterized protein n=2 Tax=Dyadobacter sandarakinus TaxID=2747268 RepID=A0ABX7IGU8_9BACT|nr:hypothetical protein HWI92_06910 [Dyadobacter sandarakinus]